MHFYDLNINEKLKKVLEELEILELTPIQEQAIPVVLEGHDIIGQAPTGTGKTFAYSLPVLSNLKAEKDQTKCLILCPTRELAVQVCGEIRKLLKYTENIKVLPIYGGQSIEIQLKSLKNVPSIIVGTPGRVIDHLKRKTLDISKLDYVILDEADEMLNMGFKEDLDEILQNVSSNHQTLLFSATMPKEIKRIAETYLHNPIHVKTLNDEKELPEVYQYYVEILQKNKIDCLCRMLDAYNFKQALVFCRTKKAVDELSLILVDRGYKIECLHGDMKQVARDQVMKMFKEGIVKVLIATDVAARGLDVNGIDVVFNFDIPDNVEYYVHRIGRTARANNTGSAYTFVNRQEKRLLHEFERVLKTSITKITPPSLEEAKFAKMYNLLTEIVNTSSLEDVEYYKEYVNNYLASIGYTFDMGFICGALLKLVTEGDAKNSDLGNDITEVEVEKKRKKKDHKVEGFTRCFINLGLKDNMSKMDLIDLVKTKRHVNQKEIINVDVLGTYSFFDIPDGSVSIVMDMLNSMDYKGRSISVEIAGSRYDESKSHKKKSSTSRKDSKSLSSNKEESKKRSKPKSDDRLSSKDKTKKSVSNKRKSSNAFDIGTSTSKSSKEVKKNKPLRKDRLDIKW